MGRAAKGEGSIFAVEKGYRGYITVNGRRKYASGTKKTEVAQKLRELKNQRDNGVLSLERSPKLSTWIAHWMKATETNHKLKTHADYQRIIERYLPGWLGDITLAKLTPEHLEDAYAAMRDKGLSGATAYQLHSIIRASLTLAQKRGRVPVNVALRVVSPPVAEKKKVTPFSERDLAAIYQVLAESRSKARFTWALELGPRPGEALGVEWPSIDFDEGSILLCQQIQTIDGKLRLVKYTKTDDKDAPDYRKQPLPGYLADLFREQREMQLREMSRASRWEQWRDPDEPEGTVHAFVFTSARRPGRPITPKGDYEQWGNILTAAGLPHAKPYTARHTAASRMIAAGIDLAVVADILGHSVKVLMSTYTHALEERKQAAARILEAGWNAPYSAPYRSSSMHPAATP
ncbi:site-specific integrase [Microbacterium resistens]|uniref:tyrosine-type recombinase/integrase n=1 Tax=Microbacterium resistens TaxID=156977 RepID=UPI001C595E46|nr:tyrosine-type recombinase/integrase [Microbacterium resistens]MBW1639288.1 site-specific integrase [Microbacterium resistens]